MKKPTPKQSTLPLTGESTMFNPLSTQVGGQHYKQMAIQPVEFCELNQLPYCMANVIKYASRHKLKHGREDLEKAVHYCDLGLSMYEQTKEVWLTGNDAGWKIPPVRFCKENGFSPEITKVIIYLCSVFHRGIKGYRDAKAVLEKIILTDYAPRPVQKGRARTPKASLVAASAGLEKNRKTILG